MEKENESHLFALELLPIMAELKVLEIRLRHICEANGVDLDSWTKKVTFCKGCKSHQLTIFGKDREIFCAECSASHGWETGGWNRNAQTPRGKTSEQILKSKVTHRARELQKKYSGDFLSRFDWPSFIVFVNQKFSLFSKHVILLTLRRRGEEVPTAIVEGGKPSVKKVELWERFCDEFSHQPRLSLLEETFVNPLYKREI